MYAWGNPFEYPTTAASVVITNASWDGDWVILSTETCICNVMGY